MTFLHPEVRDLSDCGDVRTEYWTHVSSQGELPIAAGATAEPLTAGLEDILTNLPGELDPKNLITYVQAQLLKAPQIIHQLRLLVGVSDKRFYLDMSYQFSREPDPVDGGHTLCGCDPQVLTRHSLSFFERILSSSSKTPGKAAVAARVISQYLVERQLGRILELYSKLSEEQRSTVVANLILPKETQQNEAKRRGHGAEVAFANAVESLDCSFLPEDKIQNPMGSADPNVELESLTVVRRDASSTFSFDLLVLNDSNEIAVTVQGLVQSSDPGQFGVDKSNQSLDIRRWLDAFNASSPTRHVELWGVVDGVGYSENKEGTVNKMLVAFHEFVQMKSLYKVGLGLHRLGLCTVSAIQFDPGFYSDKTAAQMADRYVPDDVRVMAFDSSPAAELVGLKLGCATLFVPTK